MKRLFIALSSALLVLSGGASAAVRQGTGFYVNPDGHLITNRHVVEGGCARVIVEDLAGNRAPGSVVQISRTHDLALLRSSARGVHGFFRVNDARDAAIPPRLNEPVHIIGFPEGEFGPRGGLVTALQDPTHGSDGYTISLSTTFGASGSPVFDDQGLLVGIVWGGGPGSMKAYAIKAQAIFPMLNQIRVGTSTPQQAPIRTGSKLSPWERITEIGGIGAAVTVKVFCLNAA